MKFRDKCDKVMWPLNYLSPRISPSLPLPTKKKKKLFEIAVKFICFIFQRKQQSPREVMLQDMFVNLKKPTTDLALWLELRSSLETHNRTTVPHHFVSSFAAHIPF